MIGPAGSSKLWALVPMKRLAHAKLRLAPQLADDERRRLAVAMLRDVLDVLSAVKGLARTAVVTGDPEIAALARRHGARIIDDPQESGTNDAVRLGLKVLAAGGCTGALVVPGDIPFVSVGEIEAALSALSRRPVVLVPASRDGGTNLLGLVPASAIEPGFGADSFARHLAAARAAGVEPEVLALRGAGHDIDLPSDLWAEEGGGPALRTRSLIARLALSGGAARPLQKAVSA